MDALLWELLADGSPDEQVEVLIRLSELGRFPSGPIKVVAQIGNILSCRIRRGDIETIHSDDAVFSMKAPKTLNLDPPLDEHFSDMFNAKGYQKSTPRRPDLPYTGKGTVIGIADWGIDFTHPNFINPEGTSRFIALWDQGADFDGKNDYGYGTIHFKGEINEALDTALPFRTLNYHPGSKDVFHHGMHGTHVLDISAGNGSVGLSGMAPQASIIAVHLATDKFKDLMDLGNSVRVFDAIHFLDNCSGNLPLVINMSVGSHGDAHAGLSLIEQAIDHLVTSKTQRAVVQSCGNYFTSRTHTKGYLSKGESVSLEWLISKQDKTPNEIEIWYEAQDEIKINLKSPDNNYLLKEKGIGKSKIENQTGDEIGRYYHRTNEPNTKLNQIVIILDINADGGKWEVSLVGQQITSGRYQAWIERDGGNSLNQSRFAVNQANSDTTTGSICNGYYNICVGAFNSNDTENKIGSFSSVGPTWDGRLKPDVCAPGVGIVAAKSASPYQNRANGELTSKTGTSMAAPYIAGTIALLYEVSGKPLAIQEVRSRLFKACSLPDIDNENEKRRYGFGVVNIETFLTGRIERSPISHSKNLIMDQATWQPGSIESLLEEFEDGLPTLNEEMLCEYFESLPPEKILLSDHDIERGDILIRRQYGHPLPVWYGIVQFVLDNEAQVYGSGVYKKIRLSKDRKYLDWELKRVKSKYFIKRYDRLSNHEMNNNALAFAEDKPPTGAAKAAVEADLVEFKTSVATTYGKWTTSTMLKVASSVSGSSGLPVGGQYTQTSKLQGGERVMGAKAEFTYGELKDIFKKLKIENFTIKLGGEWSGSEISAYGSVTFDFVTTFSRTPAALKIFIFKVKEGEGFKIAEVEGYFDSPNFEIKIGGVKNKVFIRYKVSWKLDKAKVGMEILKKIAKEKLEQEAKKQAVKFLGRKAGETALKHLGPIITAFGIGWDIGTLLNDFTIADEVALDIQQEILGDLNVKYAKANTLGKMILIAKNSPKIVAALIASGIGGVTAGIGDLVLFKLFGLDRLSDFGDAFKKFAEILDGIPNVGGGFVDLIIAEIIKIGIKLNPQYSIIREPEVRKIATAIYTEIKPMYKIRGSLDKMINLHLYDFDIDYEKFVDLIIKRKLIKGTILNINVPRQQLLTDVIDLPLKDFLHYLEVNNLISYKIKFRDELGTDPIDQKLVNELFL